MLIVFHIGDKNKILKLSMKSRKQPAIFGFSRSLLFPLFLIKIYFNRFLTSLLLSDTVIFSSTRQRAESSFQSRYRRYSRQSVRRKFLINFLKSLGNNLPMSIFSFQEA